MKPLYRFAFLVATSLIPAVALTVPLASGQSVIGVPAIARANQRLALQNYLRQHRLEGLLVRLLEYDLTQRSDKTVRHRIARDLADLYAWQLNTSPSRLDDLSARIDRLTREFPDVISLETRTSLAFGRYRHARDQFETWIWNRQDHRLQQDVNARFASVIQRATDALERLEVASGGPDPLPPESAAPLSRDTRESALARFRYLAGWSRYYRSLTLEDPAQQTALLRAAESDFLDLLEVADTRVLTTLRPRWFPLNSEWTCRVLLGLGMTEQALQNRPAADFCFNLLAESRVPADIRNNGRVWKFHSLFFSGQMQAASQLVDTWKVNRQANRDSSLWSSVAIAGMSWPGPPTVESRNMTRAGLTGLIRANEFGLIDELLPEYPAIDLPGKGFFEQWISGYALLKRAENDNQARQAMVPLSAALESATSDIAPLYRARCRYHYGYAGYQAKEYRLAASQFRQASAVLQRLDPALAEHAKWMHCQTLDRLAARDPTWKNSLRFALREFQQLYPGSNHASEAAFMLTMNELGRGSAEHTMATLQDIPREDANYQRARFELCRLWHRRWNRAEEGPARREAATRTVAAADEYFSAAAPASGRSAQVRLARVCLFAADTLLHDADPDSQQTPKWLERCRQALPSIDSDRDLGSDYHFLALKLASLQGAVAREAEAAEWLLKNATRKPFLRAALISQARMADLKYSRRQGTSPESDPRHYDRVIDAWQRLVDEYATDPAAADTRPVARAAALRLAELKMQAGRVAEARDSYQKLHEANPGELAYLQGLARSEMQLDNPEAAAGWWRTIAAGTRAGDESWLEAKYNLIVCLLEREPGKARDVFRQTRLLVPDLPAPWWQRFDELEPRLKAR